ncbi:MAG: AAA domain-containing protein [Treponema sp.]|nr:AAA domain-containing protein [Treponema sp.]
MNAISKDIFRSIHEGKWLYVEYQNSDDEKTKYWISINNINIEKKSLEVTGLHLGNFTTKNLFMFVDKILATQIMDGTFYHTNKTLLEDIDVYPEKYSFIFSNIVNLKTLNYLADCNKLADLPKINNEYTLIKKLDATKIQNHRYNLDDEQFKLIVNSFKKTASVKKEKNINSIIQLALNVLSVHTPKGLYVLAYREVMFDVAKRSLLSGNKIKICTEFCVDGTTKQSIQNFIQSDEMEYLENIDQIPEFVKDLITENIHGNKNYSVDDCPYFICLQRNTNINLEKEYEAIIDMYANDNVTIPIQAFFGELHSVKANSETLPIALIDRNVNLDQLLAIHNAINYPVAYIQGPPGTGKTTTIINTIITAFFNNKTVLFSSYNNHPIDGVIEKLTNLKYRGYTIPFPILRIASNDKIPETIKYIKNLLITTQNLSVFTDALNQNKQSQIERTRQLTELLQKHEEQLDLKERRDLIEAMLSKNENMNLRLNLEGQQKNAITKRLKEIGNITDEEALALLYFDHDKLMQFINFTSVKYLKQLYEPEYKDFIEILKLQDEKEQITRFNKYVSVSENIIKLQKVFPVFCATCISTQKIGEPKLYFDMTIMDEASQCNTAVSLVPIIRGKSLMLVGDPQQLNPVITLDPNINLELKAKYNVNDSYDYIKNSIYKAFLANDSVSQETLLHNHYRCAKEIIEFNNKKYYNNQLNVKSRVMYDKPLMFCEVAENYSSDKNTAPEEVETIIKYVKNNPGKKIGIITPFKNQKDLIEHRLKEEHLEQEINCGTVHAFQGDEKDEILFSLALTDHTHEKTYDWLKNNRELLNVAVSRAKEKLILISSNKELKRLHKKDEQDDLFELANYVQTNGEYKVTSRENSSRALGIKPYSSETEDAFLTTLNQALSVLIEDDSQYSVKREVQTSHLFEKLPSDCSFFFRASIDFVIYKKGFRNKEFPVLAIELDGPEHHDDPKVMERDEKKKQICKDHGFTLIHVDNTYARRYNFLKDILTEFFGG